MGTNEDLANPITDELKILVCEECSVMSQLPIAALAENAEEAKSNETDSGQTGDKVGRTSTVQEET